MSANRHYTDEELVSFLDGECSGELAAEIALALETDEDLALRMTELDLDKEALRRAFDPLLEAAPAPEMSQPHQANTMTGAHITITPANDNKPSVKPFMRFAALLLAGVIGYSASFLAPTPAPKKPGWVDMVVSYQQLYGKNSLAHIKPDAAKARAELAFLSEKLGRKIDYDSATSRTDIALKKTQLLEFNGKALVQMAYSSPSGAPLALCIIKSKKPGDAPPKYAVKKNMQMAIWRKGGYAYLLIGGQDKKLIEQVTADFSNKL